MFCSKCGAENEGGKKFCADCGAELAATRQADKPGATGEEKKRAGGFWKSGAGIALIAIAGIAVLAGITLGIVFAVKGGGSDTGNKDEMKTMNEWQEDLYEKGEVTWKDKDSYKMPTEEELGLPIYPGAEIDKETDGYSIRTTKSGPEYRRLNLITGDDLDKVAEWYRSKLAKTKGFADLSEYAEEGEATFVTGEGSSDQVLITKGKNGKTLIFLENTVEKDVKK